ncbi:MAG: M23 family metallopeptidase [Leifsonia sp.]
MSDLAACRPPGRPRPARGWVVAAIVAILLAAVSSTDRAEARPSSRADWRWPMAPPVGVVRDYRAPDTRYSAGHRGIDLAAVPGAPVLAVTDGVVSFAGTVVDRPLVTIAVDDGILVSLEPVDAAVEAGERVVRGRPIGVVATGGHCGEGCLHLGVRVHGEYASPRAFIGGIPRAILLPLDR